MKIATRESETHPNALVELHFLFIIFVSIEWIEADAVVEELCSDLSKGQDKPNTARRDADLLFERFTLI
jgi:hypothetical protein